MKEIEGYEGMYIVTRQGEIRSLDRIDCAGKRQKGKPMKLSNNGKGYITVLLCKNGKYKTFYVHRLVAEAFIPNPKNLNCVNHKDGNKLNNCVSNLEWCTRSENMKHACRTGLLKPIRKLSDEDVKLIRSLKGEVSCLKLAERFNVSFQLISDIWRHKKRCNGHIPV